MKKPSVAASSYLNAAPLCYSFIHGSQRDSCEFLSDEAPFRCAELLSEKRADAGLIPVIEYQRVPDLSIVPGACVASKSKVHSVLLASRMPIEEVRRVALDTSSRTSAALIQIIFQAFYDRRPEYTPFAPRIEEMIESNDAALIIGDPAMMIDRRGLYVYDLAEEWRKHTGLPFVFAFWAVRNDSEVWPGGVDFDKARREGLESVDHIASIYASRMGRPRAELITYLTENISYDFDDESMRGLKLYFEMAKEYGLIERAKEMVFCE